MTHPHCTIPAKRIADARAAIAAMPTVANHWLKDSILYELDAITFKLNEISADHQTKDHS